MTFSIVARCNETGMFGVAVSSSSPAVAARCAFARAEVGAVTSQNITDPSLGPRCLDLMAAGQSASQAIEQLVQSSDHIEYRQLTAIGRSGEGAVYSGSKTLGVFGQSKASDAVCAGNLLDHAGVPEAMTQAFDRSSGHLADRILTAMTAAIEAGGEAGPVHSAGLLLVDRVAWPIANLRVDWHAEGDPIGELGKLWALYRPQMNDYVNRALNPRSAPSYGVPGDE